MLTIEYDLRGWISDGGFFVNAVCDIVVQLAWQHV